MASVVINETYDSLIELQVQLTPLGHYMAGPAANFGGKYQTPKPGYVWHAPQQKLVKLQEGRLDDLTALCRNLGLEATGQRATLIGRLTRGSTRNIDQVPADWEKFCIVHAGAALTNEHTNDDASNVSFAEGIAELISATAAIAAPTMGNLDGLTPEQKTVGLRMLRVAVLRSRVAASRARDASPDVEEDTAKQAAADQAAKDKQASGGPGWSLNDVVNKREQLVIEEVLGTDLDVLLDSDDTTGLRITKLARRKLFEFSNQNRNDAQFKAAEWAQDTAARLQPPAPAKSEMPDPEQLGRLMATEAQKAANGVAVQMQEKLEEESGRLDDSVGAVAAAINSVGCSSGKGHNLYKKSAETLARLKGLQQSVKAIVGPVPEVLAKMLKKEQDTYKLLGLCAAKVNQGSLDVLDWMEDQSYFDSDAAKQYREAEKQMDKEKKRKATGNHYGYVAPMSQPVYNHVQQYAPRGGQAQQVQFQGGQQQLQQGGQHFQQQGGGMGRGITRTLPAHITQQQQVQGGSAGFKRMGAGLRLVNTLPSATGKIGVVHLPDRNLVTPVSSQSVGGSQPNNNQCYYCGTMGHDMFECPTLRRYFSEGKVDPFGHPHAEFQL